MNVHFLGIEGVGMSALAQICRARGFGVTGWDIKTGGTKEGPEGSVVVYSTAIPKQERPLHAIHRSELLELLMQGKKGIFVAGAHGKTTSTALLAHLMRCKDPSFVVGGYSASLGSNGYHGSGDYFIAEADESDGSFLRGTPYGAIITNIDVDHLEFWGTRERLFAAYDQFIRGVKAILVREGGEVASPLLGKHNRENAGRCVMMARALGVSEEEIQRQLSTFRGVKRRLEWKGNGVYDDYAHHPEEIKATLAALRETFPKEKTTAIFQPHRYTRFREFFHDFKNAFSDADEVIITDIYGAGEAAIDLDVASLGFRYVPYNALVEHLKGSPGIKVTLGAGDITQVAERLGCAMSS